MSKAICCDRCGLCFNPYSMKPDDLFISFENPKEIHYGPDENNRIISKAWPMYENKFADERIDLCESCSKDFIQLDRKSVV